MSPPPPALDKWLPFRRPNPAARLRLFCLPFAGGGASVYRPWDSGLPLTVELCAVQPPGRETRFREPAYTRMAPLIADLADAIEPLLDLPAAFYGHSMGALTAFELSRELRRRDKPLPVRLIAGGRRAPDRPLRGAPLHALPDVEFRMELKRLNGTRSAVLENDDLMRVLLPVLRADFTAHESYEYSEEPPLDCPILTVTGADDTLCPPAELAGWRRHTRAAFEARVVPGDHFFLQSQRESLLPLIARFLESASLP
jgi:medium-chain acyl-[acyl-carrier-protein] hydrolase